MTLDGPNNLDLTYNYLNLTEKVLREGTTLANYAYLSDEAKLSATDADGNGLHYFSLVYRKQDGNLSLESAAFSGGRFVTTDNGMEPHYFLTDHLGSAPWSIPMAKLTNTTITTPSAFVGTIPIRGSPATAIVTTAKKNRHL